MEMKINFNMFAILAVAVIILSIQNCQGAPPSADPVYSLPSNRPSDPSLRTIGRGGLGTILEVSGNQDDKNRILDEFAKQKSGRSGQSILYRSLIPEGDESRQFTNFEQIIVVESPVLQLIKPKNPADKRREKTEKRIAEAEKRISDI